MDKNKKIAKINGKDEVVFGKNKKTIGFKNHFIKEIADAEYQAGIKVIVATANNVSFTGLTGGTNVVNVLTNDTLGGVAATTGTTNLTTVTPNANLVLNPNGSVNIVNPTPAGVYTLTYRICQKDRPTNCAQAVVTVTVVAPV